MGDLDMMDYLLNTRQALSAPIATLRTLKAKPVPEIRYVGTVREWRRERMLALYHANSGRYRPIFSRWERDPEEEAVSIFLRTDILGRPDVSEPS